jgi:hypothetical protein
LEEYMLDVLVQLNTAITLSKASSTFLFGLEAPSAKMASQNTKRSTAASVVQVRLARS